MSPLDITPQQYHAMAPAARADIMAQVMCELAGREPGFPQDGYVYGSADVWSVVARQPWWHARDGFHMDCFTTLSEAVAWLRPPAGAPLHRRRSEARKQRSRRRRHRLGCHWQPERESLAEWLTEVYQGADRARRMYSPRGLHGLHGTAHPCMDPHGIPESEDTPW